MDGSAVQRAASFPKRGTEPSSSDSPPTRIRVGPTATLKAYDSKSLPDLVALARNSRTDDHGNPIGGRMADGMSNGASKRDDAARDNPYASHLSAGVMAPVSGPQV